MRALLLVSLGGALGTALRYAVAQAVAAMASPPAFPVATFAVNALGCFALGLLSEADPERLVLGVPARLVLGTGVLGGFTTYSTFNTEALRLAERGEVARAALYVLATFTACALAGLAGLAAGRALRAG